jgi:hypothetical protein
VIQRAFFSTARGTEGNDVRDGSRKGLGGLNLRLKQAELALCLEVYGIRALNPSSARSIRSPKSERSPTEMLCCNEGLNVELPKPERHTAQKQVQARPQFRLRRRCKNTRRSSQSLKNPSSGPTRNPTPWSPTRGLERPVRVSPCQAQCRHTRTARLLASSR